MAGRTVRKEIATMQTEVSNFVFISNNSDAQKWGIVELNFLIFGWVKKNCP
jgi:hypothetical protein